MTKTRSTLYMAACLILLWPLFSLQKGVCGVVEVSPRGDTSVAAAIRHAHAFDTIYIQSGIYEESNIVVAKPMSIIGIGEPMIDGRGEGYVMTVTADDVYIAGLTIKSSGKSFVEDYAGLLIEESDNCIVEENTFLDNFFALYLAESTNCQVRRNRISGQATTESKSGNGIHLWYCRNVLIEENTVTGHRDGIYFEFVKHSRIRGNYSHHNLRYGLHFMFSDTCVYRENDFEFNGAGVAVMYTHFVTMEQNSFRHHWGSASYGLLLKEISDSRVSNNTIANNTIGIYIEGCNRVNIVQNDILRNGWGLKIMANAVDNRIYRNNFLENSFEVSTNSRQNFSMFGENYWSDYDGYDLDRDGFGDIPFRPVSLYAIVVQRHPQSLLLLRSLFISILNEAERIFPSLTPPTLVDNRPAMGQWP